jgi:hypothetical protein
VGWRQLRRKHKPLAIIALSVEGGVAVIVAFLSFLSTFGEGPVQQYYDWLAVPSFYAGAIVALSTACCAIWLALPFTHVAPRAAVAITLSFGLVLGPSRSSRPMCVHHLRARRWLLCAKSSHLQAPSITRRRTGQERPVTGTTVGSPHNLWPLRPTNQGIGHRPPCAPGV